MKRSEEKVSVKFFSIPDLKNVRVVKGTHVSQNFTVHTHRSFTIGGIVKGTRNIMMDNETVTISAGECFLIPPKTAHACSTPENQPHDYVVLSIPEQIILSLFSLSRIGQQEVVDFETGAIVDRELFNLLTSFPFEENSEEQQRIEWFNSVVIHLLENHWIENSKRTSGKESHHAVASIRNHVSDNLGKNIALDELTQLTRISGFHLSRIFRKEEGIPPHTYLLQERIKKALSLLSSGETIAATALKTGFTDQSHFSRFFKRHVGITPGEFIKTKPRTTGKQ